MRRLMKEDIEPNTIEVVDVFRWEKVSLGHPLPFGAMWYSLPPNSASPQDCHPEAELSVVVQGTASVEASGQITDVAAGGAFLLFPGEAHIIHNRSAEPLTVFSAYWMPLTQAAAETDPGAGLAQAPS